jgi:3-phosphoshikimate 1-carboxyvinyltransferase
LTDRLPITPASGLIRGRIRPPGSKSITNRALVCAALARGESTLAGALDSEDTRVMIAGLSQLGIRVDVQDGGRTLVVHGRGGRIPATTADLFVGNSGTTVRFLTALCTLAHGSFRLDGVPRMRERPIGDLLDALNQLGANCRGTLREGFPPVEMRAGGLAGGQASVRGDISSQFLSGLLMAAPYAANDVELAVVGQLVSKPYVLMTLRLMQDFGVRVEAKLDLSGVRVPARQQYFGRTYEIEPDASAASYFWAAAAITGGEVTVEGLTWASLQGDVRFVSCLEQMGCRVSHDAGGVTVAGRAERGVDVDMNAISDTVQTLAVVALFANGPTTIRGVGHIRHKETDRIGDLARELRKLGATVDELPDGLRVHPIPTRSVSEGAAQIRTQSVSEGAAPILTRSVSEGASPIEIETYHDHRMAMSLALAGLRMPGVVILDPGCTAKTYPQFFHELAQLSRQR